MKKNIYLAAVAFTAFIACNITEIEEATLSNSEEIAFEKGQMVTLTVNAGVKTKVTSELNASDGIDFKWEAGDMIKVTVNGSSAAFTVSRLIDDGTSAEFTGNMPESGTTFDAQFPYDAPTLTTQEYVEGGIPHNMMLASATGCTIGDAFSLSPKYAALRFIFYGLEREITQIAVNNTTDSKTYTLTCSTAVQIGADSEHATSFLIVVPTGTYSFRAELTSNDIAGAVGPTEPYLTYGVGTKITATRIGTTSSKTFSGGVLYSLPATSITTIWAPVNCGYDATNYPNGLLYQWGRQYGQAYKEGRITPTAITKTDDTEANKDKFGKYNSTDLNWFSGGVDDTLWNGGTKGTKDPCPAGWRVSTMSELDILVGGDGTGTESFGLSGWDSTNNGSWFNGTASPVSGTGVFLPTTGWREYENGGVTEFDNYGYYWSSTANGNPIWRMRFIKSGTETKVRGTGSRARGYAVRCVVDRNAVYPGATLPDDMTSVPVSW